MRRWRQAGVVALAATGFVGAAACGAGKGSDAHPAIDDVSIVNCAYGSDQSKGPEALLSVTNHSTKASSYAVVVKFVNEADSKVIDQVTATVKSVDPNQTTQAVAASTKSGLRQSDPQFLCDIQSAARVVSP